MRLASYWIPEMELAYAAFQQKDANAETVEAQLKGSLDSACVNAERNGHPPEHVQNALYAVVAWIDELAMSFDWPGAVAWRLSPLQRHYFATTRAGVGFFDRLQALPAEATDVREVFALMLVAGFQGDFAHRPAAELKQFRRDLLIRVAQDSKMLPLSNEELLFPGAYALGKQTRMRPAGPSIAAFMVAMGPPLLLLGLYIYLNAQLSHEVAQLIVPVTAGL